MAKLKREQPRRRADVQILVPTHRITPFGVVPMAMAGQLAGAAVGHQGLADATYQLGRTAKPRRPILVYGPDERVKTVIMTDGETEMAELEDVAHAALEKQEAQVKKTGRALDFDERRERGGLVPRNDASAAMRNAIEDRIKKHKANPRTDPPRDPRAGFTRKHF